MDGQTPATTPAAPAPPAVADTTPQTSLSATETALAAGSTSAYRAAKRAERAGQPLPEAPAPAEPAAPAAPAEPKLSRREREQQDANERTRWAVEQATADLRAENERLLAAMRRAPGAPAAPPAAPAAPASEPAATVPEWKRYAAMPDAPKLADFDSVEDHSAAMALFVSDKRHEERAAADRARQDGESLTAAQRARVERFVGQLDEVKASDPTFVQSLTPEVRALKPFAALQPGERGGPLNVLTEQIFDSPIAPTVLKHLSTHPEELRRFETMPAEIAALPPNVRTRAHIQWIVREYGRLEARLEGSSGAPGAAGSTAKPKAKPKTITDAPAPIETLGSRPADVTDPLTSAIRSGDTRTYRELRRSERAARLVPMR